MPMRKLDLFIYPAGSKSNVEQFVAKFDHVKYLRDSQIEILNAQREERLDLNFRPQAEIRKH